MLFEFDNNFSEQKAKIKVVGVGGAGGNAINRMISSGMEGVEFIAINTDAQDLESNPSEIKVQIGKELTKGLGAGAKPEIGREAILQDKEKVSSYLAGADMVFVTAGMGGGTGTGAAPVVAKICKDLGILTVCIVTLPFGFEGPLKMETAMKGVRSIRKFCDTLIVIPNQKLLSIIDYNTTLEDAFSESDLILLNAAQSISDLIHKQGNINTDFADVKTVMSGQGDALLGTGIAKGEERAVLAAQQAISSPLLDNQSIAGAKSVLLNITASKNLKMREVESATQLIYEEAGPSVKVIFGCIIDEKMGEEMKVTVIATGLEKKDKLERSYLNNESIFDEEDDFIETSRNLVHMKSINSIELADDEEEVEEVEEENDGPTLIFDDFDQTADYDVPAYLRKKHN